MYRFVSCLTPRETSRLDRLYSSIAGSEVERAQNDVATLLHAAEAG